MPPLYNFSCPICKSKSSRIMSWKELEKNKKKKKHSLKCSDPKCEGRLVKMPSTFGFNLKGSGWHKGGYN